MWKTILADDEIVILNGLQKLINWESLQIELVDTAEDGPTLLEKIREQRPRLVISDIKMPGLTGLEVLKQLRSEGNEEIKFIFISGFEEFSFAREALALGAVDYLMKPVSKEVLEGAVKKATGQLEQYETVEAFREDAQYQDLFCAVNEGQIRDNADLQQYLTESRMNLTDKFFAGICIGFLPETVAVGADARWNLQKFAIFNRLVELFAEEGTGFFLHREENRIHLIGVFPKGDEQIFYEKYVHSKRMYIERNYQVSLVVGVGTRTEDARMLKGAYQTGRLANELYFFEEKAVIDFETIRREYAVSFEDYQNGVEALFRSIIAKDGCVLSNVDRLMELIQKIHYGNPYAAKARVMHFTGDIGMKLYNYKLLDGDFYAMQNALQEKVEAQRTFRGMHTCIMNHYENLTAEIYRTEKSKDTVLIEKVKSYIREHFAEDLSVKELADFACVSTNYFSAMFKRETGGNYKAYLTGLRMERALELLLNTDMKTYEIGEAVGYNNVRRFVDAFKQIYGMSPMDYKKKRKQLGSQ